MTFCNREQEERKAKHAFRMSACLYTPFGLSSHRPSRWIMLFSKEQATVIHQVVMLGAMLLQGADPCH